MQEDLLYRLALNRVRGIGPVYAKSLYRRFGDAAAVFSATAAELSTAEAIPRNVIKEIKAFKSFDIVEKELHFLDRHKIRPLFFTDPAYPQRLLRQAMAPPLLFYLGNADLNASRMLAVIGTRIPTQYGKSVTASLLKELAGAGITIISGLAYGIDTAAHAAALEYGMPTIGIPGHGLDRIYPAENRGLARKMVSQGGLLTRFNIGTEPDECHFPLRNQLIAAMSDAVLVIETAERGGSLLTVRNAIDYRKRLFAIPGRVTDPRSKGCNMLIAKGQATLLGSAAQLLEAMSWTRSGPAPIQTDLFGKTCADSAYTEEEQTLLAIFRREKELTLDELLTRHGFHNGSAAIGLLRLELRGILRSLPGKKYCLIA